MSTVSRQRLCDPCSCCPNKGMEHDQQDKGFDLVRCRGLSKRYLVVFEKCVYFALVLNWISRVTVLPLYMGKWQQLLLLSTSTSSSSTTTITTTITTTNMQRERQNEFSVWGLPFQYHLEQPKRSVRASEHAMFIVYYEVCSKIVQMKLLKCFLLFFWTGWNFRMSSRRLKVVLIWPWNMENLTARNFCWWACWMLCI